MGEPMFGDLDIIDVEVCGQKFVERSFTNDHLSVGSPRVRYINFGKALERVGRMIVMQAEKGKPTEITLYNGEKIKTF